MNGKNLEGHIYNALGRVKQQTIIIGPRAEYIT